MILDTIYEQLSVKKDPLIWVRDEPTDDDIRHIRKSGEPSKFDTLGLRFKMLEDLGSGKAKLICKSSSFAKVLAIVYPDTEIPWDIFAKIFQAFGRPKKDTWRIVWFANPTKRHLPDTFVEPDESHVNGGYTYACEPSTIVIYRKEEVCRVLVHELLHAACTDDMHHPEHIREVLTET